MPALGEIMSESRAMFLNGKWKEITACINCRICGAESDIKHISLFFDSAINPDCPLPLYDRVRWHDAKREFPEGYLNVAVKMLKDGKVVYGTGLATRDGTWVADGIFIDGMVKIEILEWRYYE